MKFYLQTASGAYLTATWVQYTYTHESHMVYGLTDERKDRILFDETSDQLIAEIESDLYDQGLDSDLNWGE